MLYKKKKDDGENIKFKTIKGIPTIVEEERKEEDVRQEVDDDTDSECLEITNYYLHVH